jgi:DnaK suppressor protein
MTHHRTDLDLALLRTRLLERKSDLEAEDAATAPDRAPVDLDQQAVGRLSRMDALQGHAMAEATHERRLVELRRIAAALQRLEEGDYGYCLSCDRKIAAKRLELDPAVPTCVTCAAKAEG